MKYFTPYNISMGLCVVTLFTLVHVLWRVRGLGRGAFAPKDERERAGRILWALAIFKYISGVTKVGCMAFLGGTVNMHLDPRVLVAITAYVAMMTFTEGFVDITSSRLAAGKPPIGTNGTGHTQMLTKEDAAKTETLKTP